MPITVNAEELEARYAGKSSTNTDGLPPSLGPETVQAVMGTPVPDGTIVSQRVGRGEQPMSSMMVVPPRTNEPGGPQIGVVPPTGASRTTIGTIVEPLEVKSTTNPLDPPPPTTNSGLAAEPVATNGEKPPKKKKFDLTQLILDHIWELGGSQSQKCQDFYEKSEASLRRYIAQPSVIPLDCVLRFIHRQPELIVNIEEEVEPHFAANREENWSQSLPNRGKTSVVVCAAVLERPTLPFMWTLLYLAKKYELGFDVQSDTMVTRSRNMLAHRFLASNATWSLWIDGDMACPIANRDWYKWITGTTQVPDIATQFDVLTRLQMHQKAVVGAVYASRKYHGSLVIQPEIRPRSPEDRQLCNEIRRGTAQGLYGVDWIGFGCAMVHRNVFLEVQRTFPQLAPEAEFLPWRFFDTEGAIGEDEAFCRRVRACDIPIWLDCELVCGHIGNMCYMPEHTAGLPSL